MSHKKIELPVNATTFTEALRDRLREEQGVIPTELIAEFCNVTPHTVNGWFRRYTPAGGLVTLRLAYLMQAAGFDSPELEAIHKGEVYSAYVAQLLAYGVIDMAEARELCGSITADSVLRDCRGGSIVSPKHGKLADLKELYDAKLAEKVKELEDKLNSAAPETSDKAAELEPKPQKPTRTKPKASKIDSTAPVTEDVPVVSTDNGINPVTQELLSLTLAEIVDALIERLDITPQQLAQQVSELMPLPVQVTSQAVVSSQEVTISAGHVALLRQLAGQFNEAIVSANYLLTLSDEDHATVRELMGNRNMYLLKSLIERLCGPRANLAAARS